MSKKLLSILCVLLCLCVVLTACSNSDNKSKDKNETEGTKATGSTQAGNATAGENGQTEGTNGSGETAKPWEQAIKPENFNNFTVKLDVAFTDGNTVHDPDNNVYAINGNAVSMDGGKTFDEKAELTEQVKTLMIDPVRNLIANAENVYMNAEGVYSIPSSACALNYSVYQGTISATDIVLTLDADGHLATFSCKMVQDVNIEGEGNVKLEMDVTFTFSNYGTTGQT